MNDLAKRFSQIPDYFRNYIGTRRRTNPRETQMASAADFLHARGGTVDWPGPRKCEMGYETIFQFCAAEYFAPTDRPRGKIEAAQEYAEHMRRGFQQLQRESLSLIEAPLFMVPRVATNKHIEVITWFPEYVVNADGQVAFRIQYERDSSMTEARMLQCWQRQLAVHGNRQAAEEGLLNMTRKVIGTPAVVVCQHRLELIEGGKE